MGALSPGSFVVNGPYVLPGASQTSVPAGIPTNVCAVVGGATDGKVNTPIPISTVNGSGALLAAFGTGTKVTNSLVRAILSAMPECTQFVAIRVTDTTDVAATLQMKDTASPTPATVITLTANNTGSEANKMTATFALQSGTMTNSPVLQITINYPNNPPVTYSNITAYSTSGGAYNSATFIANALAAINGTAPNTTPNPYVTASAGVSTATPNTGVTFTASGGTDGASGITTAMLEGTDGISGRTGMYALRGTPFGVLHFAGCTDPAAPSIGAAFCAQVGGLFVTAPPAGTSTASAISLKTTNNIANKRVLYAMDWDYVADPLSGTAKMLVSPMAKVAGIVASLAPWQDPTMKPYGGATNLLGTERTAGQPVDPQSEGAQRQANGILYLTNQMQGAAGTFRLPHGFASDGTLITNTRMYDYISSGVLAILGQFVGEPQTPPPAVGAVDYDKTRNDALAALNSYFDVLANPNSVGGQQIAAYRVTPNNTATTVAQGFLNFNISVTTLTGVQFAVATLQVGNTVQIVDTPAAA